MENWPIHLQHLFNQARCPSRTLNKTENYFLVSLFLCLFHLFAQCTARPWALSTMLTAQHTLSKNTGWQHGNSHTKISRAIRFSMCSRFLTPHSSSGSYSSAEHTKRPQQGKKIPSTPKMFPKFKLNNAVKITERSAVSVSLWTCTPEQEKQQRQNEHEKEDKANRIVVFLRFATRATDERSNGSIVFVYRQHGRIPKAKKNCSQCRCSCQTSKFNAGKNARSRRTAKILHKNKQKIK